MLKNRDKTRAELVETVAKAIAVIGSDFPKAPIVSDFVRRGVRRSTAHRWINEAIEQAAVILKPSAPPKEATGAPLPIKTIDGQSGAEVGTPVSSPVSVEGATEEYQDSLGAMSILKSLQHNLEASKQIMEYARKPDGSIRNAKLLMSAAESLRRGLETANRIFEAMHNVHRVEAFHRMIIDEIAAESPACAKRIWDRLERAGRNGIA